MKEVTALCFSKNVCFLWNQFKYQSRHSRKMSAVYFALLFDLESKKDDFDKNALQLKIKTLYEQNPYRRNLNFSSFYFKTYRKLDHSECYRAHNDTPSYTSGLI